MENEKNFKNRSGNRALTGIILVAVGTGLLLRNLDFPIPEWLFTWPMLLIVIGIYSGIKHSFRNNSWIILIGIGGFFLADQFVPGLRLEPLFWPILFIAMGILFILRPAGRWSRHRFDEGFSKSGFSQRGTGPTNVPWEDVTDSGDYFKISSVFSGVKRTILSKDFKGGYISCVFGGAEIDLTQADINGRVIIRLEEVFGGTKLIVPSNWIVQNEIEGVFHGVDDKRKYNTSATVNPEKVLILKGSCVFAGVEIRSY